MPGITIGGDDVTEITIDGEQVQEVTVGGATVWSAGPIPRVVFSSGFEQSGLPDWSIPSDSDLVQSPVFPYEGSNGGYVTSDAATVLGSHTFDSTEQPSEVSFALAGSKGSGVRLENDTGTVEVGAAIGGPDWYIDDGDGIGSVYSAGNGNNYHTVTMAFDWAASTVDVTFTDTSSGYTETFADRPLTDGGGISSVVLHNFDRASNSWVASPIEAWFDAVEVLLPPIEPPTIEGIADKTETSVLLGVDSSPSSDVAHSDAYVNGSHHQEVEGNVIYRKVDGLSPGTTYDIYITATDDAGNESEPSNTVTATTTGDAPSQAIHHYPMDEGSGASTISDAVGNADITLNGPSWTSNSRYTDGVAPDFDGEDDFAQGQPDLSTPFTLFIRVYTDGLGTSSPNYRTIICDADDNNNSLMYDIGNNVWRVNTPRIDIADSDPTGEHILALRSDSNQTSLRLYDSSGSLIDSNSVSGEMDFSGQVNLGRWDDSSRLWDGALDNLTICDEYLTASETDSIVAEYY